MITTLTNDQKAERDHIYEFVKTFYTSVRQEPVIGPIFNEAIAGKWDEHFEILTDFWVTVLLGIHTYKGNPFLVHRSLPDLRDEHFDIWLGIFEDIAKSKLKPALSEVAIEKAHRIASSLRQGLFFKVAE